MNIGINDKLDVLIALAAKECGNDDVEMFNNLDTSDVILDKRFYSKQRQVINKHKNSTTVLVVKKFFVRAAVAIMALMSLGFLTVMAVPSLREAVYETIIEWYDGYISIRYEPVTDNTTDTEDTGDTDNIENTENTDDTDESTDNDLSDVSKEESSAPVVITPPTKIEKVMKPTYIPDGLEEEVVASNKTAVVIDYYLGEDLYCTFQQVLFQDNDTLIDSEGAIIEHIDLNGNPATIIDNSDKNYKIIVWTDGMYFYQIYLNSASESIDELIKMASSVR